MIYLIVNRNLKNIHYMNIDLFLSQIVLWSVIQVVYLHLYNSLKASKNINYCTKHSAHNKHKKLIRNKIENKNNELIKCIKKYCVNALWRGDFLAGNFSQHLKCTFSQRTRSGQNGHNHIQLTAYQLECFCW